MPQWFSAEHNQARKEHGVGANIERVDQDENLLAALPHGVVSALCQRRHDDAESVEEKQDNHQHSRLVLGANVGSVDVHDGLQDNIDTHHVEGAQDVEHRKRDLGAVSVDVRREIDEDRKKCRKQATEFELFDNELGGVSVDVEQKSHRTLHGIHSAKRIAEKRHEHEQAGGYGEGPQQNAVVWVVKLQECVVLRHNIDDRLTEHHDKDFLHHVQNRGEVCLGGNKVQQHESCAGQKRQLLLLQNRAANGMHETDQSKRDDTVDALLDAQ